MPHIVVLDAFAAANTDLSYEGLAQYGSLTVYDRTAPSQVADRMRDADIVITNKCVIDEEILAQCPKLSYIGVVATGYNNIDIEAAKRRQITVTNVPSYSTDGVAQLVFSYLLDACTKVAWHNEQVQKGAWCSSPDFCFYAPGMMELQKMTLGIFGFGSIGRQVAKIAHTFGMEVLAATRTVTPALKQAYPFVRFTDPSNLWAQSDAITLHCPLTPETEGLICAETLAQMKPTAFLINTSRGPVVREADLVQALQEGKLAGAYLDVIQTEPMPKDSPLLGVPNLVITPHIAWAARPTRQRLLQTVCDNVAAFLAGKPVNQVTE